MIAAMAVAFSATVMAQENNSERRFDRTEMAQRRTDMMAERYGLNDEQKAQLLDLNKKYSDMMPMGPRPGGGNGHRQGPPPANNNENAQQGQPQNGRPEAGQRRGRGPGMGGPRFDPEKMKEYEEGLKQIMTPEQFEKYDNDRKQRMQRMQRPQGQQRPQN